MSDDNTPSAPAPTADAAAKAKRDDRKAEIRAKAKEAAAKSGKDWTALSKDERQTFRKAVRTEMRDAVKQRRERRVKRTAAKADAASEG